MKTCPKCNASMPDDVNFCTECGTKMSESQEQTKFCISCGAKIPSEAQFCSECAAKQVVEERTQSVDIYEDVNNPQIKIQCGYGYHTSQTVPGEVTITPHGLLFESNSKGVSAFFASIATLGQKTRMGIKFKDITHMSIMQNGYLLYISTRDGGEHVFSGPSAFALGENKQCVKKLTYLTELYRRMYWYYGEYVDGPYLRVQESVGYFQKAVLRVDTLSDEELINFYKRI